MIDNRVHYYLALDTETTNGLDTMAAEFILFAIGVIYVPIVVGLFGLVIYKIYGVAARAVMLGISAALAVRLGYSFLIEVTERLNLIGGYLKSAYGASLYLIACGGAACGKLAYGLPIVTGCLNNVLKAYGAARAGTAFISRV